jgi:hypothetical protein
MAGTEDLERRTHAQAPRRRRLAAAVAIALSASVLMSGCRIEGGVGTVGHHRAAVAGAAPRLTVTTEPPPSTTTTAQPTTTTEPPSTTTARPRPRYTTTTTTLDLWLNPRWPVEPPDVETTVFWLVLDETPLAYSLYLDALELAHTTCDTLDAGVPLDVLVVEMVLLVDPQFLDLTSSVMGAGIGAFCPWHNSQVRGL